MPTIYDNIETKFVDGLTHHLGLASRVDYCVGYFNLRGWREASEAVDNLPGGMVSEIDRETGCETKVHRVCRLLVGMTKTAKDELIDEFIDPDDLMIDNQRANSHKKQLAAEFAEQLTFGVPRAADEKTLKKLLEQLKSQKVAVKLFLRHQLHAKLYLAHIDGKPTLTQKSGLLGSSNFTLSGLSKQGELNIDVLEQDAATKLCKWFNDRWNDKWCIDITEDLIEVLENSWARSEPIPPYHIYLKIAYHLSREARAGLAEYKLSKEMSSQLFEFQQAAVKIAAHHLHHRHGVMVGDVVGLGKTYVAAAIAKILEDDLYYNTLIICPPNLITMWNEYVQTFELHALVKSHAKLNELADLKRYKLVIVDESQNFRNNLTERYRYLRDYIQSNDSKVVLLSATPYNKSFVDLSNQLKLFLPDDLDLGIAPDRYIESLGGIQEYGKVHSETPVRTINAFEKSTFSDDWREVMRLYMVRRTRSFIRANYAKIDKQSGRNYILFADGRKSFFPTRIPKCVRFAVSSEDTDDQYAKLYDTSTVDTINALDLPRYGLEPYLDKNSGIVRTKEEEKTIANLSRAGKRALGFCRTSLFKRLESSGHSFMLSLHRHILRNYIALHAVKHGLELPVSGQSVDIDAYTNEDEDFDEGVDSTSIAPASTDDHFVAMGEKAYNVYREFYSSNFSWVRSDLFDKQRLIEELESDNKKLLNVLGKIKVWQPERDRKLSVLHELLTRTHGKEKVLVFTQYADTAQYLIDALESLGVTDIAVAIGGKDNLSQVVSQFSPDSNKYLHHNDQAEIRVLITTDALSEGQNLQDAHIVVNYDLPWALVRLVQRAGRVDRLGQESEEILCYSFLPEDGVELVIGLREKLRTRIAQNAEVVGSDETFFEDDQTNIENLYNEKSGILDDAEDNEVDLASYAYQVWKNATDGNPLLAQTIEEMPNVVFSAKTADRATNGSHTENSVVVYAKTRDDNDLLVWLREDGSPITHSQTTILKAAECKPSSPSACRLERHHELVEEGVKLLQNETATPSGILGRPNSVKHRTYERLKRFLEEHHKQSLFVPTSLKQALDQMFHSPLRESAVQAIIRQMKSSISDEDLAFLVASRFEDDSLCVVSRSQHDQMLSQVICSMSIVGSSK